jgi:hypothetical protein
VAGMVDPRRARLLKIVEAEESGDA